MKILLYLRVFVLISAGVNIFAGLMYAKDFSDYNYEAFPSVFNLSTHNGMNGFVIDGIHSDNSIGYSVIGTDDINRKRFSESLTSAVSSVEKVLPVE